MSSNKKQVETEEVLEEVLEEQPVDPTKGSMENPDYTHNRLMDTYGLEQDKYVEHVSPGMDKFRAFMQQDTNGVSQIKSILELINSDEYPEVAKMAIIVTLYNNTRDLMKVNASVADLLMPALQPILEQSFGVIKMEMDMIRNSIAQDKTSSEVHANVSNIIKELDK